MEARTTHGTIDREPPPGSPGIHAVLDVLEVLAAGAPVSLGALTQRVGRSKTTVFRVCGTLVERGWIVRDPGDATYSLGMRALEVGGAAAETPLVVAFRPIAADLVALHNETVHLAVLDGDDSIFIAKADTTHAVRLVTTVGTRLPAFAAASGRVLLADLPGEAIEIAYAGRTLVTPTGRDLGGLAGLEQILARVRRLGYAENVEETALGLHCIAVPIRNGRGRTLAAMTACVPTGRIDRARRNLLRVDLLEHAARLERHVAWVPTGDGARSSKRHVPKRERA
jgi:DNA-binding IclR family transcriptional regulator